MSSKIVREGEFIFSTDGFREENPLGKEGRHSNLLGLSTSYHFYSQDVTIFLDN